MRQQLSHVVCKQVQAKPEGGGCCSNCNSNSTSNTSSRVTTGLFTGKALAALPPAHHGFPAPCLQQRPARVDFGPTQGSSGSGNNMVLRIASFKSSSVLNNERSSVMTLGSDEAGSS